MWLTDLPGVLRAAGLSVVVIDGYEQRGYLDQQMSGVKSIVCHWTATNPAARGNYPTLNTILDGNAGTPGPLSQLGLGRDGTWYVIAAGLCNHAGVVDTWEHSNPWALGVEAEYHPDQGEWPEVQQRSYERGCAALAVHYSVPLQHIQGHYEVARPAGRKSDPNTLPGGMPGFRTRTGAYLTGGDVLTPEQEQRMGLAQQMGNRWVVDTVIAKLDAERGAREAGDRWVVDTISAATNDPDITPEAMKAAIDEATAKQTAALEQARAKQTADIKAHIDSRIADVDEEELAAAMDARGMRGVNVAEVKSALVDVLRQGVGSGQGGA